MERLDRWLAVAFFGLFGIAALAVPYQDFRRGHPLSWGYGTFGVVLIALSIYSAVCRPTPRFRVLGASGPTHASTFVLAAMVLFLLVAVAMILLR